MEKTVKVTVNLKHARPTLRLAGFFELANDGTDEEVFAQVLAMMSRYGAKTEIVNEPAVTSEKKGGWCYRDGVVCCRNCGFKPNYSLWSRDGYSNADYCPNCGEKT